MRYNFPEDGILIDVCMFSSAIYFSEKSVIT
jgi:hypothetical protein